MRNGRIKPNILTDLPDYKTEKKLSFPDLKGGLNLSAPDTEIKANESPEMQNLCFMEGALNCRDGQRWLDSDAMGSFRACFPELWHGALFAHLGTNTDLTCFSWQIYPRDLTYRCLAGRRFPNVFVRRPYCRHVKHFSMRLYNNQMSQDMSVAKADVYFNLQGKDRGFLL